MWVRKSVLGIWNKYKCQHAWYHTQLKNVALSLYESFKTMFSLGFKVSESYVIPLNVEIG